MFGIPRSRTPKLRTREESLAARPIRVADATLTDRPDGGANLKVPVKVRGLAARFLKMPDGATKTFELDPLGLLVWNLCDGKNSVQQIIRKLAKRYDFNLREAEVSTLSFLGTLVRKGLIAMAVPARPKRGDRKD
jgi:hypothetical protein